MKIGVIGAGNIGATVAKKLAASGHDVKQPGTPAYCTELTSAELASALATADKARAPTSREMLIKEFMAGYGKLTHDDMVMRNRVVTA